ncbi:two-component sensor histidine kinase [Pseudoclavibacter chungangensis]|uniref:Sensor-like histidine kinase SenX3 n=1 Tax=Pseudoclavibacter chungangensis TaxID=587635 RepID=A0A7J5C0D6_9MICO|nr:ATP-binding protein [Pseudoclavibacter chungangensis]KAB1660351.1 two-component sensor histidine kinase [Pseudoclavibacter chungangensis]NYJ65710.1 two-component system sensor histidine kinase SenX3 [Pseudoclavibacter chungangensis]
MDSSLAIVIATALGFLIGGGFVALLHVADQHRQQARAVLEPRLPDGIEHLLGALDSIVIVCDPSHNVYQSSPGATSKGLVLRGGRLATPVGELVDAVRRAGEPITRDLEIPRGPFGSAELMLRVRAAPLATRFILILADDRTEAVRVENVRRDFVANVSHELKTPIGAVSLLAEAIDAAADDPEQVRYFTDRLVTEAGRLGKLTNELINLSRLQSADSLEKAEILELRPIVEQAVDQARVAADAKRISITLAEGSGERVYADPGLLVMGFHNLVANAINYSPEGSGIGIGIRTVDGGVEVAVTDQGIGIAPEDQGRVFERFFRVDAARSRLTGGTGLGLSIVKHVVENHGGDIRLWSQPGRGSTFTVRLPLADADEVAA